MSYCNASAKLMVRTSHATRGDLRNQESKPILAFHLLLSVMKAFLIAYMHVPKVWKDIERNLKNQGCVVFKSKLYRGLRRVNTVNVLRFRNSSCCRGRIARTRHGTRSRPTQANGSSNSNMSAAYERELNEVFLAASTPSWGSKLTSSSRSLMKRRDAT